MGEGLRFCFDIRFVCDKPFKFHYKAGSKIKIFALLIYGRSLTALTLNLYISRHTDFSTISNTTKLDFSVYSVMFLRHCVFVTVPLIVWFLLCFSYFYCKSISVFDLVGEFLWVWIVILRLMSERVEVIFTYGKENWSNTREGKVKSVLHSSFAYINP